MPDGAERLLRLATWGLPRRYADWGRAVRAELHAIGAPSERRTFARSAAAMAFVRGGAHLVALPLAAGILVAAAALAASRVQLAGTASPGILVVTVPIPALLILCVAAIAGAVGRSFAFGLVSGLASTAASVVAVFAVSALEGLSWMDRRGVFVLDADPPKNAITETDVVFDFFTTGMWLGHLLLWLSAASIGAVIGAGISGFTSRRARLA